MWIRSRILAIAIGIISLYVTVAGGQIVMSQTVGTDGVMNPGKTIVGIGGIVSIKASLTPITGALLLEDGTSILLLEDNASQLCLEGGC